MQSNNSNPNQQLINSILNMSPKMQQTLMNLADAAFGTSPNAQAQMMQTGLNMMFGALAKQQIPTLEISLQKWYDNGGREINEFINLCLKNKIQADFEFMQLKMAESQLKVQYTEKNFDSIITIAAILAKCGVKLQNTLPSICKLNESELNEISEFIGSKQVYEDAKKAGKNVIEFVQKSPDILKFLEIQNRLNTLQSFMNEGIPANESILLCEGVTFDLYSSALSKGLAPLKNVNNENLEFVVEMIKDGIDIKEAVKMYNESMQEKEQGNSYLAFIHKQEEEEKQQGI